MTGESQREHRLLKERGEREKERETQRKPKSDYKRERGGNTKGLKREAG